MWRYWCGCHFPLTKKWCGKEIFPLSLLQTIFIIFLIFIKLWKILCLFPVLLLVVNPSSFSSFVQLILNMKTMMTMFLEQSCCNRWKSLGIDFCPRDLSFESCVVRWRRQRRCWLVSRPTVTTVSFSRRHAQTPQSIDFFGSRSGEQPSPFGNQCNLQSLRGRWHHRQSWWHRMWKCLISGRSFRQVVNDKKRSLDDDWRLRQNFQRKSKQSGESTLCFRRAKRIITPTLVGINHEASTWGLQCSQPEPTFNKRKITKNAPAVKKKQQNKLIHHKIYIKS